MSRKLGIGVLIFGAVLANGIRFLEWLEERATKIPVKKVGR